MEVFVASLIVMSGLLLAMPSMGGIVNKLGLIADQLKRIADHLESHPRSKDAD